MLCKIDVSVMNRRESKCDEATREMRRGSEPVCDGCL